MRVCAQVYMLAIKYPPPPLYGPVFGPRPLFRFLNPIHSWLDSLDGGSYGRKAATYTQNKRKQTSIPRVGFNTTIPVF
jgi:hypothetical protein